MSSACAEDRRYRRRRLRKFAGSTLISITAIMALARVWRERSQARRQLAVMSDRELHDIGVCRTEVADEIGRPFWVTMKGRLS